MTHGYVHSVEVGSFVDGPGVRFVVFLAGCPLRCAYCHNPDAWQARGQRMEAPQLLAQISRTAKFLVAGGGGVTVSGGEPLMQADFAREVLAGAKELGLHTALDTSGYLGERVDEAMLDALDLVLLDIKSYDPETYRDLTGVEVAPTLALARRLSDVCKPVWVRFVLVPGVTDDPANVAALAAFVGTLSNVERVEIIPFHKMGEHKYDELGIPYRLAGTREPSAEEMARVKDAFAAEGVAVDVQRVPTCAPAAD